MNSQNELIELNHSIWEYFIAMLFHASAVHLLRQVSMARNREVVLVALIRSEN